MTKYLFKLPIGDWSDDGHGYCKDFIIECNMPIEKVFDAYFITCEKFL